MKKLSIFTFIIMIILITIFFINGNISSSNSVLYEDNEQITNIINNYVTIQEPPNQK